MLPETGRFGERIMVSGTGGGEAAGKTSGRRNLWRVSPAGWVACSLDAPLLRAEAPAVLVGVEERLDHLGVDVVAAEDVELREPVVVAVPARVWPLVRVPPQVAEVLHQ